MTSSIWMFTPLIVGLLSTLTVQTASVAAPSDEVARGEATSASALGIARKVKKHHRHHSKTEKEEANEVHKHHHKRKHHKKHKHVEETESVANHSTGTAKPIISNAVKATVVVPAAHNVSVSNVAAHNVSVSNVAVSASHLTKAVERINRTAVVSRKADHVERINRTAVVSRKADHYSNITAVSSAGTAKQSAAVVHYRAQLHQLRKELDQMKSDLGVHPWELKINNTGVWPPVMDVAHFNATFLNAQATSKKEVTEADLKKQLHVLCDMLTQLEETEAVKKEEGQQEIESLRQEVKILRQEIDNCRAEEAKKAAPPTPPEQTFDLAAPAPSPQGIDFDCEAGKPNWKLGWSPAKKEYCCKKDGFGCMFDCEAGYPNWKKGWSPAKKEYCCAEAKKGCPEDENKDDEKEAEDKANNVTGEDDLFDCDAGLQRWEKGWSEMKKSWCCKKESKGCLFDCEAGLDRWEKGWSQEKKEFCCEHADVGCKFDCEAGFANWEKGWSEEKKDWCCIKDGRSCKFDCDAGFSNWEKGWSEDKKEWCCLNKMTPTCTDKSDEPEAVVTSSTEEHGNLKYEMPSEEEKKIEVEEPQEEEKKPAEEAEDKASEEEETEKEEEEEKEKEKEAEDEAAAQGEEAGEGDSPRGEEGAETEPAGDRSREPPPERIEPGLPEERARRRPRPVGEWDRPDTPVSDTDFDIDGEMPYGDLEPFGREDTAQELTENSIKESDEMVDQLERAEVAEEKRAVFRALTRLRGAAITSFDGIARSQTGNIDEYNKRYKWRETHPLHHLADEESDVKKWAFPEDCD